MNESGDREFAINYIEGGIASLSSSIRRFTTQAKKLAEKFPEEVKLVENTDGSVYMQFPSEWIKFPKPKRRVSDKQKQLASERLRQFRKTKDD